MSISIKNHEDRIKALENKTQSSGTRFVQLGYNWNGFNGNFSESISNFDLVEFVFINDGRNVYSINSYSSKILLKYAGNRTTIGVNDSSVYHASVKDKSVSRIWSSDMILIGVFGLKIYYIFRYNIYKILKLISPILKFW